MKDQVAAQPNEIRCKLHITTSQDTKVKNSWMCLNYTQKPTISHIIEHIKRNFFNELISSDDEDTTTTTAAAAAVAAAELGLSEFTGKKVSTTLNNPHVKLYLEDYWLPPYENSRLIRENDCIKVNIKLDKTLNSFAEPSKSSKIVNAIQQANIASDQLNNALSSSSSRRLLKDAGQQTNSLTAIASNYNTKQHQQPLKLQRPQVSVVKPTLAPKLPEQQQQQQQQQQQTSRQTLRQEIKCHKKFSIGNYAHMLDIPVEAPVKEAKQQQQQTAKKRNYAQQQHDDDDEESDDLSEEQVIDDYYHTLQHNNPSIKLKCDSSKTASDLDRIAASINSHGAQKWKNTSNKGPTHIIFSSSDEEDEEKEEDKVAERKEKEPVSSSATNTSTSCSASSSSSDSSSTEDETKESVEAKKPAPAPESNEKKQIYFEQTKEQQLNAVCSNESYLVTNPKTLIGFKSQFNEKKLNAPPADQFSYSSSNNNNNTDDRDASQNSSFTNEVKATNWSKNLLKSPRKRSVSPQDVYESFEPLVGQPRLNDKIAFQILEISSNFSPELSSFKTAVVSDFDAHTNEVTLKLSSKYNMVLKKANKFNVVFDDENDVDGKEEVQRLKDNENFLNNDSILSTSSGLDEECSHQKNHAEIFKRFLHQEEILKVDWRNLINVKLLPHTGVSSQ
jgi:hypothetical protein